MGRPDNSCARAHGRYQNKDRLASALWRVVAKRGGLKRRPKIEADQVNDMIREIRQKAKSDKREKMGRPNLSNVPSGKRADGALAAPMCYSEIDYADQGNPLRKVALWPDHTWAATLPQPETGARRPLFSTTPSIAAAKFLGTKYHVETMQRDEDLEFLRDCSPHLSPHVSATVLKDSIAGQKDTRESAEKALKLAAVKGIPSLQLDARQVLDTHRRMGRMAGHNPHYNEVALGCRSDKGDYVLTDAKIAHTNWELWDFGDSIPTKGGDPILDAYDPGLAGRNKCLLIHLAAGVLWARLPITWHQRSNWR